MHKLLLVDDDTNLLAGLKRQLRKEYEVDLASSGAEALEKLAQDQSYAVVVSDMRMPEMDGVELLGTLAEKYPGPSRIMLTGNADQQTAMDAVNRGHVYQFLNKPCDDHQLKATLKAATEFHSAQKAEQELLEQTLAGSVMLLMDVVNCVNPVAYGRVCHMKDLAVDAAKALGERNAWQVKIATLASSIGWIGIPESIAKRFHANAKLTDEESQTVKSHVDVAYDLLHKIPRMEPVARIVRLQDKRFDGGGYPTEEINGDELPIGARILKVLNAITPMGTNMYPSLDRCKALPLESGEFDPAVVAVIQEILENSDKEKTDASMIRVVEVSVVELLEGDVLEDDLFDMDGSLLLSAGHELSGIHLAKLQRHPKFAGLKEKILVARRFH